jgi:ADP-ribose diphosphatase
LDFASHSYRQYERLKPDGDGAVLVVPMLDDDTVLMIYEYYIIETFA